MDLVVNKVDLHCEANNSAHRTNDISKQRLIVRRGQSFLLTLSLPRPFNPASDTLLITAETGLQASESLGTRSVFNFPNSKTGKAAWGAEFDPNSVLLAGSVTLAVTPPADAPVGQYSLFVKTKEGEPNGASVGSLLMLFNPWCKDDWVYLGVEEERQEYVMKEQSIIYRGLDNYIDSLTWNLGQFEEDMVETCLMLLDVNPKCLTDTSQDYSARCNPIYVGRVVSAMINCNDDRGVLMGNWSNSFAGGVSPTQWNGSVDILRRWRKFDCNPVKYGQCWVYAGVMCTVLRCLGIPCRIVTNFQSAHDTDGSLTVDEFYGDYGVLEKASGDSVWNYHVWVEAWMKRPDLSDDSVYDGWQVLDPTPQEKSSGVYCCGPTPVKAILLGHTNVLYDAPFVFAEVNADLVTWLVARDGSKRRIFSDSGSVGQNISTKSVGSDKRQNITDNYKHREGTTHERVSFNRAVSGIKPKEAGEPSVKPTGTPAGTPTAPTPGPTPGPTPAPTNGNTISNTNGTSNEPLAPGAVEMKVVVEDKPLSGADIRLKLVVRSLSGAPCSLLLHINVQAMKYTGTLASQVQTEEKQLQLAPRQELTVPILIPFSVYGEHMLENNSLMVSALATDQKNPKNVYLTEMKIIPKDPALTITSVGPAQQYRELMAEVVFMNPLDEALKDCTITVTGSGVLQSSLETRLAWLPPGHRVRVQVPVTPYRSGQKKLVADFNCNSFRNIKASCNVDVAPYNRFGYSFGRFA
ncbi:protein-glutamine gamma-glutamyltransferase 2-like isoform X1 [Hypomesus transpacificus]|uniref:protein-glutamine gamma-glutamyltransferase 2-like isoform X1 n=1 Tax=Hypomesus transpacificus TaxID=137520 RepID=UPI001F077FFB|nr:protein-glutamine gamma-glutamyltransferase 2-like isoform X1 [Hypomesus transpacificus]